MKITHTTQVIQKKCHATSTWNTIPAWSAQLCKCGNAVFILNIHYYILAKRQSQRILGIASAPLVLVTHILHALCVAEVSREEEHTFVDLLFLTII
jgi:hypothetical protein